MFLELVVSKSFGVDCFAQGHRLGVSSSLCEWMKDDFAMSHHMFVMMLRVYVTP